MGLPRKAHSSSACRPRWGWGREGSQMEAAARELQVPRPQKTEALDHTLWLPPSQDSAALLARCYSDLVPQTGDLCSLLGEASQSDWSSLQNTVTQGL